MARRTEQLTNDTARVPLRGNLDEAAGRLHEAIDVIELNWGGGGLNIIFGAGRELRPWRAVPVVQDVHDRLLTLMAASEHENMTGIDQAKHAIRERVWSRLESTGTVEPGVRGYIPAFYGADQAAERLADLRVWAQRPGPQGRPGPGAVSGPRPGPGSLEIGLRWRCQDSGQAEPFFLLNPDIYPTVSPAEAADRMVAARVASMVSVSGMPPIDLIVCGSVAVNEHGARLGKGAGYSDIEVGLLAEAGLIGERTVIATTAHELQVLDEEIPEQRHDFRVDLIVTPERVVWCGEPKRPTGLDWDSLSREQIAAIPVLARRAHL